MLQLGLVVPSRLLGCENSGELSEEKAELAGRLDSLNNSGYTANMIICSIENIFIFVTVF